MIKLLKSLLLLPIFAVAQINIENQWKNSVNPIFQNLDKNRISSKILLDNGMEFTNLAALLIKET